MIDAIKIYADFESNIRDVRGMLSDNERVDLFIEKGKVTVMVTHEIPGGANETLHYTLEGE